MMFTFLFFEQGHNFKISLKFRVTFKQAVSQMMGNLILLIQSNTAISRIKLILSQMIRNKSDLIFTEKGCLSCDYFLLT